MKQMSTNNLSRFNSVLSFGPLLRAWESIAKNGREGSKVFYQHLLDKVNKHPELLEPIEDLSILEKHKSLIEEMMATIFPITSSEEKDLFAVAIPFSHKMIYSSALFKSILLNEEGQIVQVPDDLEDETIIRNKTIGAYQIILKKFYGIEITGSSSSVHRYRSPFSHHDKFMELEVDPAFIDVKLVGKLPTIPKIAMMPCQQRVEDVVKNPTCMNWLPLHLFKFEGIAIVKINEVTERESINNIKNSLLTLNSFSDVSTFKRMLDQLEDLVGVSGVRIGITPFLQANGHFVFSELDQNTSLFYKNMTTDEERTRLFQEFQKVFKHKHEYVVVDPINDESQLRNPFLQYLAGQGWKSILICPLYSKGTLMGLLEVVSDTPGKINSDVIAKIEPAIPLFELALEKSSEILNNQIDKVIKEQFTAVQRSVDWRFTEAALKYLSDSSGNGNAKLEPIVFEGVYPLYGAIDIRNSSTERNAAIQQDLLEQLHQVKNIINKAQQQVQFPLLQEIDYRISKYKDSVSGILFSDDELSIQRFLREEVMQLFRHLKELLPELENEIETYFSGIDPRADTLYHHRKEFETSITYINNEVARFIDKEQVSAQQIFPHYFERFVTDGVDFNIYIGQSITPNRKYDPFYLKNLKIWQLSTLAKAARLSKKLEKKIPLPLQTTQLILTQNLPISISFRTAERKFDVDGAYNIRYEIVKKRIDKVRIRDSNERFTQAGTIAIVYSNPAEATEYMEYIDFLQYQGLLKGEVQKFDLEELQGVSGLKGIRVAVNYEEEPVEAKRETPKFEFPQELG